jgi:hypothetical protein
MALCAFLALAETATFSLGSLDQSKKDLQMQGNFPMIVHLPKGKQYHTLIYTREDDVEQKNNLFCMAHSVSEDDCLKLLNATLQHVASSWNCQGLLSQCSTSSEASSTAPGSFCAAGPDAGTRASGLAWCGDYLISTSKSCAGGDPMSPQLIAESIRYYQAVLQLQPDNCATHYSLGMAQLWAKKDMSEVFSSWLFASRCELSVLNSSRYVHVNNSAKSGVTAPLTFSIANYLLANNYHLQGRAFLDQITYLKPGVLRGYNKFAWLLQSALLTPEVFQSNEHVLSVHREVYSKLHAINSELKDYSVAENDPASHMYLSSICMVSTYRLRYLGVDLRAMHELYAAMHLLQSSHTLQRIAPHTRAVSRTVDHVVQQGKENSPRILKVGFISHFLSRSHSIGRVLCGLIQKLPRDKFEVYVIRFLQPQRIIFDGSCSFESLGNNVIEIEKAWTTSKPQSHHHAEIPLSVPPEVFDKISSLELDILFFGDGVMGWSAYFLMFSRLARIQIAWWDIGVTTGISNTIDFYVAPREALPKDQRAVEAFRDSSNGIVSANIPVCPSKSVAEPNANSYTERLLCTESIS